MRSGFLLCPKCHEQGMNSFDFYESIKLNDGKEHWSFYFINKENRQCKFWALLEECGHPVNNCADLCNCCFNPCDKTPDVVTYENGIEVN